MLIHQTYLNTHFLIIIKSLIAISKQGILSQMFMIYLVLSNKEFIIAKSTHVKIMRIKHRHFTCIKKSYEFLKALKTFLKKRSTDIFINSMLETRMDLTKYKNHKVTMILFQDTSSKDKTHVKILTILLDPM